MFLIKKNKFYRSTTSGTYFLALANTDKTSYGIAIGATEIQNLGGYIGNIPREQTKRHQVPIELSDVPIGILKRAIKIIFGKSNDLHLVTNLW